MKSVVEELSPTRVKVEVSVDYGELKPYIEKIVKQAALQIQIPGFRSGKAPARLVERRIGREYIVGQAVSQSIDDFYREAIKERELVVLDVPEVDVKKVPQGEQDPFEFVFEADIRPEVELPEFADMQLVVSEVKVNDSAVDEELEDLRLRFGTLKTVERAAVADDFVTIDLETVLDGEEVDQANDLSYRIGSGTMLPGIDEALMGLEAGVSKTFTTVLDGGKHSGEEAEVTVTLKAVKERELPDVNDEFAQLASEFETIDELKADLQKKAERAARTEQGVEARDVLVDKLVQEVSVELPENFIDKQVDQKYGTPPLDSDKDSEKRGSREDLRSKIVEQFKQETIFDIVAEREGIEVDQSEVMEYISMVSSQYGMESKQFAAMLSQSGQIPSVVADIRRRKAIAAVLADVTVKDRAGNLVDLEEFINPAAGDEVVEVS